MVKPNMEEARVAAFNRLGNCEVCSSENAQYTCPRCELKTCCLNCVSIHKKELECSGERDKTGYVPISKFTNLTLLSDYRFLEDVTRTIANCKRNPLKKYTRFKRPLPSHLWRLRTTALKGKTTLHFLPQHFTRHKENTTQLNFKTGIIFWKIDLIFPQGDNIKISVDKCSENDRLSLLLSQFIDYEKCPDIYKNNLKFYHSCGLAGIEVLLKAENVKGPDSFFLLDMSLTLKENLEKMIIIEYPILCVILKDHKDEYTILDSDADNLLNSDRLNVGKGHKFTPFHYFDAVSYTTQKMDGKREEYARSISSSVAELKKYFAAGDSDDTDEEIDENQQVEVVQKSQQTKKFELSIPTYDELVNKVGKI